MMMEVAKYITREFLESTAPHRQEDEHEGKRDAGVEADWLLEG